MRGAYISACFRNGLAIHEIAPTTVKKLITGHGHASKEDIAAALKALVGFQRSGLPHDATDALAIALSYALTNPQ